MDQVSPAVVENCLVETSGWEKSQSPIATIDEDICPGDTDHNKADSIIGETLSSAISAATVTLLDEDLASNSPSTLKEEVDIVTKHEVADDVEQEETCDFEHQSKKLKMDKSSEELPKVKEVVPMDSSVGVEQTQSISVKLEGHDLWQQFYHAGTEMIITKTGR